MIETRKLKSYFMIMNLLIGMIAFSGMLSAQENAPQAPIEPITPTTPNPATPIISNGNVNRMPVFF